jgi:aspartyl/glutamyl-tRNA(Asn/Gln) amidotransferase C subunit
MNKKQISIDHLEKLANLKIKPAEAQKIGAQLEETVDYFRVLDQLGNLDKEKATFQVTDNINILAEDKTRPSLKRSSILPAGRKYFHSLK